jgi:hypothetical protein
MFLKNERSRAIFVSPDTKPDWLRSTKNRRACGVPGLPGVEKVDFSAKRE